MTECLIQVAGTVQRVQPWPEPSGTFPPAWLSRDVLLGELAADGAEHVFVCTHTCLLWGAEG